MWTKIGDGNIDVLNGKRIAIIGSSSADLDERITYWNHIRDRTGCVILDYADGGSTLTATTTNYSAETTNQLKRIDELPTSNIDLVVIQPCANDENNSRPLGTWDSTTVTEVYGALHTMAKKMYDKYPTLPFGVITGQYANPRTNKESVYMDAVMEVCAFYSIPCVNLKKEGRTPYTYDSWRNTFTPDNTHLNPDGAKVLSYRVESFTRSLLGH
jgi:lysophospholipase L1-like esterase